MRVEEDDAHVHARAERLDDVLELGEEVAAADVDDRRDARQGGARTLDELDERSQHLRRQVVDDVPAEVFERVADGGATGTGHAGDDQHLLLLGLSCHRLGLPFRVSTLQPTGAPTRRRREGARAPWPRAPDRCP